MFGRDAKVYFVNCGYDVISADIPEVDITEEKSLETIFSVHKPDIVINAAAYTNVDGAEKNREEAYSINVLGTRNVSLFCKKNGSFLVHISTDYVFPGTKEEGYYPNDETGPSVNYYGETKLLSEKEIIKNLAKDNFLICRTQWLYGKYGKNFVKTIFSLSKEKDEIDVVNDQWGVPTWTKDLAEQIGYLLEKSYSGFAHTVGGKGPITWFQFAKEIVEMTKGKCKVNPIPSEKLKRDAKRPKYGFLRNDSIPLDKIRDYKESLTMYLKEENFL